MATFPAKAYSYQTVSASTGEVNVGSGVLVKLTCEFRVSCYLDSSTATAGSTHTGNLRLEDGKITIAIFIPSPIDQWFQTEYDFYDYSDFTNLNIPITNFVSANVELVPTASIGVSDSGPASLSPSTLTFGYEDYQKQFTISVYSSAQGGTTIYLEQNFNVEIRVGLAITFFVFNYNVVSVPIGSFPLAPTQFESISVPNWYETLFGFLSTDFFMLILFLAMAAVIGFVLYSGVKNMRRYNAKRKQSISPAGEQVPPSPSPSASIISKTESDFYCIFCGAKLPPHAVFCRKCGKKQE
jgi:hypothetical protein